MTADLAALADARALLQTTAAIDLHLDTFIPTRLYGYDVDVTHDYPFRHLIGHVDLPRAARGGLKGGLWSITTNPFRSSSSRLRTFQKNLPRLHALVARSPQAAWVTTATAFDAAVAQGRHAVLPVVQGANCLGPLTSFKEAAGGDVVSATLVHLTSSNLGETSTPLPGKHVWGPVGLTAAGRAVIESMNAEQVLVDLAHAAQKTFWDVVAVADGSQPLLVTHTGVSGVFPHWRNIDDAQIKAVADSGGVVGVIFHPGFLGPGPGLDPVVAHLAHVVDVVGEDHAALGSDWDGFISPPPELKDVTLLPGLVAAMLQRGWSAERVRKILGENFLRCLRAVRP
ncbi:MAG: membrane dipeptidase [Deltaproteobacteria bacterium]|nr:membrane dipeptidase [Deltaproteobacteria bacterium]